LNIEFTLPRFTFLKYVKERQLLLQMIKARIAHGIPATVGWQMLFAEEISQPTKGRDCERSV